MASVRPGHAAEAAAVAVGVLELVGDDGQAVEEHPVLVAVELAAAAADVAAAPEPAAVQVVPLEEAVKLRVRRALAAVVDVDVIDAEARDVGGRLAVVTHELLEDGRDARHVEQVAVGAAPVQRVAAHPARGAAILRRGGLLDLGEDLVELIDVRERERAGDREDAARVEQVALLVVHGGGGGGPAAQ